jgi:hypothetical protein
MATKTIKKEQLPFRKRIALGENPPGLPPKIKLPPKIARIKGQK